MRYAVLKDGLVVNVILWDGESEYSGEATLEACPDEVSIGWSHVDGDWAPPDVPEIPTPPVDPQAELRQQARLALMAGQPLTSEQAAVIVGL